MINTSPLIKNSDVVHNFIDSTHSNRNIHTFATILE